MPDTDRDRLECWLERTQATAGAQLGECRRASNGFSAETLLASWSSPDFARPVGIVIRFEQPGGEIFLDTDIVTQAETLRALFDKGIPVPELIGVEPDAAVLGRRFLVMKYSAGRTFPQNPATIAPAGSRNSRPSSGPCSGHMLSARWVESTG